MSRAVVFLGLLIYCGSAHAADDSPKAVITFLRQHCVSCHGTKKQEAGLRLDAIDFDYSKNADQWNLIRYKLLTGEMPPHENPRPDRIQQRQLVNWITDRLGKVDVALIQPDGFFHPKNGNKVDHEALFSGEHQGPAATRSRLWRMGPHAYESIIKGEMGKNVKGLSQPFGEMTSHGLKDYAAAFSIDDGVATFVDLRHTVCWRADVIINSTSVQCRMPTM